MKTPIYDFLKNYTDSEILRCHMPGHKGKTLCGGFEKMFESDITEIAGADSLFESNGIIAESEKNMSSLYKTAATVYSAGGSTLCIQAMLAIMKNENRKVFAARNVHRAFLNAVALLDIDVEWIMPEYSAGILSGELHPEIIEEKLKLCRQPSCVYVTSPDYTGKTADIRAISEVCRRYGSRLLVDNAHGAHLAFFEKNVHPIALGADICCDSAHKMLPALTGAAMLHTGRSEYAALLKPSMSLFASTSPSYLIMLSLDLCNKYISESISDDIKSNFEYLERLRKDFSGELIFADTEPFHVTIKASESGFDGNEFAEILRKNGVECEYSDRWTVILLMSPMSREDDYTRLSYALKRTVSLAERCESRSNSGNFLQNLPERAMSIRSAVFSTCEEIHVEMSEGRICGAVRVPCPPAIPIAASGEIIDRECIKIFQKYGISAINVLK
ncbi:MAG: aminotransferase class I/II-fold pyridoxal phosphate-dependent enzyme [Ruminococcus flavefaciens]|nr:aminotransferase class I/II-fold pyridoxal phosphate-dependent enzyme [Ruminococcus flavefaciens]MCM1061113.1 aminotransferase class I/II-fold pyridoxal phosphate-dependent enzyme [Eubacterium sp.]